MHPRGGGVCVHEQRPQGGTVRSARRDEEDVRSRGMRTNKVIRGGRVLGSHGCE